MSFDPIKEGPPISGAARCWGGSSPPRARGAALARVAARRQQPDRRRGGQPQRLSGA